MKIDPKTFTFDAMERATLAKAMQSRMNVIRRNWYRDTQAQRLSVLEARTKRIDAMEWEMARLSDLIERIGE